MIIVIEGADGSGKTTLYNQLKAATSNLNNYKFIEPPARNAPAVTQYQFWNNLDNDINYIFDRSFITDIVYRIIDFEPTGMTLAQIHNLLRFRPIKIIYCYTPYAYNYAMARGENNIVDSEIHKEICNVYQFVLNLLKNSYNIDFEKYSFDSEYVELLKKLHLPISIKGGKYGI